MYNIFLASQVGKLGRVEELLAQGGLNLAAFISDEAKVTVLYYAAHGGHQDVAKALIRAGAPLNVPDEECSPLHGAALGSHHDVAAMLLREGAQVDACFNDVGTPLSCAKDSRMAALLIAAGADVNAGFYSPLLWPAWYVNMDVLQELLSHPDINVNKQSEGLQLTPLHWAARQRRSECVAALLAAGADACITNADVQMPLRYYLARNEGNPEFRIIAMLVAAGDRQWDHIPSPCPGLETALLPVWKEAPEELDQLFSRLEPEVKRRIQTALCTMHHVSPRHLPDHIRMRLLDEAFNV